MVIPKHTVIQSNTWNTNVLTDNHLLLTKLQQQMPEYAGHLERL